MDVREIITLLWYGSIGLLGLRLVIGGFWRSYPAFTLYIWGLCCESLILMRFAGHASLYGKVWTVTRLVIQVLQVIAVLAVFSRWTVSFPGIGAFGRRLAVVLLLVSVGISLSTTRVAWSSSGWALSFQLSTIVNRGTNLFCSFFLLLTMGFFYKFGGPVAPNLRRHSWTLAAFVTANAVSYFAVSTHLFAVANILLPGVSAAALAYWLVAFTREGELQPTVSGNEAEWEAAEHMNAQLQKLADSVTLTPRGPAERHPGLRR